MSSLLEEHGVIPVDDGHDGRTGAGKIDAVRPQLLGQFEDLLSARDLGETVLLMELVSRGDPQEFIIAVAERGGSQRCPGQIEHRVPAGDGVRQRCPGLFGKGLEVGDEGREGQRIAQVLLDAVALSFIELVKIHENDLVR